jgi:aspartyl-tRNA(Asn)/glutamyl-tRNA(Gln) amidotransferase subunit A
VAGHDPADPYSVLHQVPDYLTCLDADIRGLRIGFPANPYYRSCQPQVLEQLDVARERLVELGIHPVSLTLPHAEEVLELSALIVGVDFWRYHQRYRDRTELYGPSFVEHMEAGRDVDASAYAEALDRRARIRREWLSLFERVDFLLLPANRAAAPPHGQGFIEIDGVRLPVRANSEFNRAASLLGLPALVEPIGQTPDGLPVGMSFVGPPWSESRLLALGQAVEFAFGNVTERWGIEPRSG